MWISGTWVLRSCLGHDNLEVEGTGDMVKYCKVVTAVLEDEKMEILICPHFGPDLSIVFRLENTGDGTGSGQDDTNQIRIGKPTDNGMVIKHPGGLNIACEFEGLQLTTITTVEWLYHTITDVFDLKE